eukprot:CAMPEP_0114545822 /NCGR_PEP_ID=MMETSP0114-20121206/3614_1 /TAXON_ID=31324 /ORGANISM="Goniomonas sp, Strain m" /LENGTH=87 /DNA_ID=CAMNT_0001730293 /DNA_START=561 /DNA_END=824 /DNA_ORIENTATION=+
MRRWLNHTGVDVATATRISDYHLAKRAGMPSLERARSWIGEIRENSMVKRATRRSWRSVKSSHHETCNVADNQSQSAENEIPTQEGY